MDKLQPLIKHRFWIIFAFSVIFAIVGWWMASGAILAATDARKKSVEESFSKAAQGKNEPNADWVKVAQERNEKDEKSKLNASKMLWQRQQAARRWPESLAKDFEKVSFQGEIKEVLTRRKWQKAYKTQIESLLEIVNPYDQKTKEGLVVVTINNIDHQPFSKWRYQLPVSTEIWTCQEDIWLMQSLLTSIARVNGEAKRITEAHVRRINRLSLRGGDPEATPGAASGGGGGDAGAFGGGDMAAMMGGSMRGDDLSGGGMGAGAGVASYPGKEFEGNAGNDILTEEFGAVAGAAVGGFGGKDGMMMSGGGSSMDMMMGGGSDGAAPAEPAEEDRYVDDKEGQYKTRAFLLDVIVRDDQLPNLLASLTNSDFPVEIRRVEVVSGAISSGAAGAAGGMTSMGSSDGAMTAGGIGDSDGSGMGMGEGGGLGGKMAMGGGLAGGGGMMPGMDMQGMGMGMSGMGMSGMGTPGFGGGANASDPMAVAMADPLLVTVKIGGLMTLYQSQEESTAQDETEKAAAAEQTTAAPTESTDPAAEGATGEMPTEGTSPDSGAPASTDTTSTETQAPADGAAPSEPATSEGEMPAEGNPPATDAGSTPESTAPGGSEPAPSEQPAKTDEAPSTTPADGATPAEPAGETPAGEAPSGETPPKS